MRRLLLSCVCVISSIAMPIGAYGQVSPPSQIATLSETELPVEVRNAIAGAPLTTEILSVRGVERVTGNILKVDELVIQRGGVIEFVGFDHPWVAVMAKRVRIVDPTVMSTIRREPGVPNGIMGANGDSGGTGSPDGGRSGRHGNDGGRGGNGTNGGNGTTVNVPQVYIIVGSVEAASNTAPIGRAELTFDFAGVPGGDGGNGGSGGRGGNGGNGQASSSGAFDCRRGPGDGGDAGNGGNGGNGGDGARGGNGGSIVFISSSQGVDVLSAAVISNEGARPGKGGAAGGGGSAGSAGDHGSRRGHCTGGGSDGYSGNPGNAGAPGSPSNISGERGRVEAIIVPDPTTLWGGG